MCTVSMVGDHYTQKWQNQIPIQSGQVGIGGTGIQQMFQVPVLRDELEALRKEVLEMKELLIRAKKYDRDTNQPDCEQQEKIAMLKKMAEAVGVSLDEVFGAPKIKV